jgi:hypothetical protein
MGTSSPSSANGCRRCYTSLAFLFPSLLSFFARITITFAFTHVPATSVQVSLFFSSPYDEGIFLTPSINSQESLPHTYDSERLPLHSFNSLGSGIHN